MALQMKGYHKLKVYFSIFFLFFSFVTTLYSEEFAFSSLEGHTNRVTEIVFSPDGKTLASASEDRTIRIWDVATGTLNHTLSGHNYRIYSVAFSPDGATLASGDSNGKIRLWDAKLGQYKVTLEGHHSGINSLSFSSDGMTLASGSSDRTIRLWNATTGVYKVTLEGHTESINTVVYSSDGKVLASGSSDRTIRLWDASTGFHMNTLNGHTSSIYNISFIDEGKTLVSMSNDSTVRFWETSTGHPQETIGINNIRYVSISSDRSMLAGVTNGRWISLWDIATESEISQLTGHQSDIYTIMFSPDNKILASGGYDREIRLWDLSSRVSISPSNVEVPAIGEEFEIEINIVGGEDVRGYIITVNYDVDSLQYVSHSQGEYFGDDVFEGPTVVNEGNVSFSFVSTEDASEGDGTLASIKFKVVARKASTISLTTTLSNSDGERLPYIVVSSKVIEPPWDVNGDGSVDILDLSYVAARFGLEGESAADVNRDGEVDIKDLITVASGMVANASAPSPFFHQVDSLPTRTDVQMWLTQAQQLNLTDPTSQKGIFVLKNLLNRLPPIQTILLSNYPNPFNPETWIPYRLSESVHVSLTIFAVDGTVVRNLELGYKPSGVYEDKHQAIHWDGKNNEGETVASGIYYYSLTAGDYSETKKMLILK